MAWKKWFESILCELKFFIMDLKMETKMIQVMLDIGIKKEKTLEIFRELLDNSKLYAGNQDAINSMLQDKLTIDEYISLTQYKIF
jgi:hypothetical protein